MTVPTNEPARRGVLRGTFARTWARTAPVLVVAAALLGACDDTVSPDPGDVGAVDGDASEPSGPLYVAQDAPPGGDGTAERPFDSVDAALASLPARAPVDLRLGPGEWSVPALVVGGDLTIVGAGVGLTRIIEPLRTIADGLTTLRDLSLSGLESDGPAALYGVDATGALRFFAERPGTCVLEGVVLADGRIDAEAEVEILDMDATNSAIHLSGGGTLRRLDLREHPGPALVVRGGLVEAVDVEVADIGEGASANDGESVGVGILVGPGEATVSVEDLRVFRAASRALVVRGRSSVSVEGARLAGAGNTLLSASDQAELTIVDAELSDASVLAFADGGSIRLDDVRGARARNPALLTGPGGRVEARRSTFTECPNGFATIQGEGASAVLAGNVFDATTWEACVAIAATDAPIEIAGNTFRRCAVGAITVLEASDVRVVSNEIVGVFGVAPLVDVAEGISLVRAAAAVEGNRVADTDGAGIALLGSRASVVDNVVERARGGGIRVVEGAGERVPISRNRVVDATGVGIAVVTALAAVDGNTIAGTRLLASDGLGEGVWLASGADASVSGNTISGSAQNGIRVSDSVTASIDGNAISGSIGAAVFEDCGLGPSRVTLGENELSDNGSAIALCE